MSERVWRIAAWIAGLLVVFCLFMMAREAIAP